MQTSSGNCLVLENTSIQNWNPLKLQHLCCYVLTNQAFLLVGLHMSESTQWVKTTSKHDMFQSDINYEKETRKKYIEKSLDTTAFSCLSHQFWSQFFALLLQLLLNLKTYPKLFCVDFSSLDAILLKPLLYELSSSALEQRKNTLLVNYKQNFSLQIFQ